MSAVVASHDANHNPRMSKERKLSDSAAFSPDLPELRLVCQLAGIKPSALVAALNNPEHFSKHLSTDDLAKYLSGVDRLMKLTTRINTILTTELNRAVKEKGRLKNAG